MGESDMTAALQQINDRLSAMEAEIKQLKISSAPRRCAACQGAGVISRGWDRYITCDACDGKGH